MAFIVDFYNFTKNENSTARPTAAPASFSCNVLRGSGLINPTIEFNIGRQTAPAWNYCYISDWARYYYITEWNYNGALWTAHLSVDALATYKPQIGAASLYALRAANSYDGAIIDTLYPAKVGATINRVDITNPFTTLDLGCFVIGVVGNTPQFGSVNYYALNNSGMSKLIQWLLNDSITAANGFNVNDAAFALQKNLIDPLQYIKSAIYIPLQFGTILGTPANTIEVFDWAVPMNDLASAKKLNRGASVYNWAAGGVDIPKHPQTGSRGNFVNSNPFTLAQMVFPPFGVIELDTSIIANANTLTWALKIDEPTGLGILTIKANGMILNRLEAQIGVPVQLSQVTRDYIGASLAAIGGASSIASGVGAALGGNIVGGVASAINGAANAAASATAALTPRSQSIGSGGSYAQLTLTDPGVEFQFFTIVDDDITHNGRPLCQNITPASIGGYMLIQDGDVPINGTKEEALQIKAALEGGFYYE